MNVRWTNASANDLERIAEYLVSEHTAAASITRRIFEAATSLGSFPYRGRRGRAIGTRELVVPGLPYIIVYSVSADSVEVLRIWHGAQNR